MKNFIVILWVSANFLASLFGLTLKPISIALEALARVTSVSVITPTPDKAIFGATSACLIFSNIGIITETDVTLARASNAILIGFNVRPNKEAKKLAETHKITIKFFNIIYEVLDFVSNSLSGLLKPDIKEQIVGSAEVQAIFKVSKIGKVAGSKVIDGEIINNLNARLIRDGNILYTGSIDSIFREKNAAKQVAAGLECGITLKDFADFKEKDVIEVYKIIETERRI